MSSKIIMSPLSFNLEICFARVFDGPWGKEESQECQSTHISRHRWVVLVYPSTHHSWSADIRVPIPLMVFRGALNSSFMIRWYQSPRSTYVALMMTGIRVPFCSKLMSSWYQQLIPLTKVHVFMINEWYYLVSQCTRHTVKKNLVTTFRIWKTVGNISVTNL
jgi:hypothetical protein